MNVSICRVSIESRRENDQIGGKEEKDPRTLSLTWEKSQKNNMLGQGGHPANNVLVLFVLLVLPHIGQGLTCYKCKGSVRLLFLSRRYKSSLSFQSFSVRFTLSTSDCVEKGLIWLSKPSRQKIGPKMRPKMARKDL